MLQSNFLPLLMATEIEPMTLTGRVNVGAKLNEVAIAVLFAQQIPVAEADHTFAGRTALVPPSDARASGSASCRTCRASINHRQDLRGRRRCGRSALITHVTAGCKQRHVSSSETRRIAMPVSTLT